MRYAIINKETSIVENIVLWDGESEWSPGAGFLALQNDEAGIGWKMDGDNFLEPEPAPALPEDLNSLSEQARLKRDQLMSSVYDKAVAKIQREIRMSAGKKEKLADLNSQLSAFDEYAVLLQDITQQEGFPENIEWPEAPAQS